MQTLGLDGTPPPPPWYRLWVWPDVADPESALGAARNGAIVSLGIGVLTMFTGVALYGPLAIVDASFYLLAAIGIRQLSFPASAMTLVLYLASQIVQIRFGRFPGILAVAAVLILTGAARAAWRALRLDTAQRAAIANGSPAEPWTEKILARTGSTGWRRVRIVFNVLLLAWFALLFTGLATLLLKPVG